MHRITVVTPILGKIWITKQMLDSLEQAYSLCKDTYDLELSVILVDNGASNEPFPSSLVSDMKMPVEIVRNKENLLYSKAVNKGLALVEKGSDILILNNDTVVAPYFMIRLMEFVENNPEYHIYGPMTNNCYGTQHMKSLPPNKTIGMGVNLSESENILTFFHIESILKIEQYKERYEEVLWVNGFCMYIRNEVFEELGYLNDEDFPLSGEEFDYCYKAMDKFKSVIDRWNFVWHHKHETANELKRKPIDTEKYWNESNAKLRSKYKGLFPKQFKEV